MKTVIQFLNRPLVWHHIAALADSWAAEHAGYYGTPAGARYQALPFDLALWQGDLHGSSGFWANGVPVSDNEGLEDDTPMRFRWLRSSGNWAGLELVEDSEGQDWFLTIRSRRHGIPDGVLGLFDGWRWVSGSDPAGREVGTWQDAEGLVCAVCRLLETQADPRYCPLMAGVPPEAPERKGLRETGEDGVLADYDQDYPLEVRR
jgi:hypothetical protein